MADLDVDEGHVVFAAEGEAPDRRVEIHGIIDADQPRLHRVCTILGGKLCLFLLTLPLPPEPETLVPRDEPGEGWTRRETRWVRDDKGTVKGMKPAVRPQLPEACAGRIAIIDIRAEKKLEGVVRM
jgi:hypothetical protein